MSTSATTTTRPRTRPSDDRAHMRSASDLAKFTALAALLAIFADAAIAHAMLWGNDPYWTYWITDTLLMATVFGLGTAWLGTGLGRGAVITAVHILLLTTYYWTLSPIGLPAAPEWLDLERTWVTGLPVHFAVYYLGYIVALWLWRGRRITDGATRPIVPPAPMAGLALATAAGAVVVLGSLQTLLTQTFPGVTWFIVRIAVAVPFTFAWWALAGRDRAASISGGLVVGFLLSTYTHFLAPVGLPNPSLRLLEPDPPSALVHWLTYQQEFLVLLPLTLIVMVFAFLLAARWQPQTPRQADNVRSPYRAMVPIAALIALVALGVFTARHTGPESNLATLTSRGTASVERGPAFAGTLAAATGTLRVTVENRNTHRTPAPPHDRVDIAAQIRNPDGTVHVVRASQPMVNDPRGRFTTWHGVGFDVWHHGRSRIGSPLRAAVHSDVAVYALGSLSSNGTLIATNVPVHVMTDTANGSLELFVGDPSVPMPGLTDGHLRVVWPGYDGGHDRSATNARYSFGTGILLVLLGWVFIAVRRQERDHSTS